MSTSGQITFIACEAQAMRSTDAYASSLGIDVLGWLRDVWPAPTSRISDPGVSDSA